MQITHSIQQQVTDLLIHVDQAGSLTRYSLLLASAALPHVHVEIDWQTPALKATALSITTKDKAAIEQALQEVPPGEIIHTLTLMECLLVEIDPVWTQQLIHRFVTDQQLNENASLGLCTAITVKDDPLLQQRANFFYNWQLEADNLARASVQGEEVILKDKNIADRPVSVGNAYIIAAAYADVTAGVELAEQLLKVHKPEDLQPSVLRLAARAYEAGKGALIQERAYRQGVLTTQVLWTFAMAYGAKEYPADFNGHVIGLCERVTAEMEAGMEYQVAPLLLVLLYLRNEESFLKYQAAWEISNIEVADAVFLLADKRLVKDYPLPLPDMKEEEQNILAVAGLHADDCFPGDLSDLLEQKSCK